jgi:energy-coupling factor transporter ATP-binding protein EcfA2
MFEEDLSDKYLKKYAKQVFKVTDAENIRLIYDFIRQHNDITMLVEEGDASIVGEDDAKDVPTNILIKRYINNAMFLGEAYRKKMIEFIESRLIKEDLIDRSTDIKEKLQEAKQNIKNLNEFLTAVRGINQAYQPFNIQSFKEKLELSLENSKKVTGKRIIILLGMTGCGKSTTIQYLCGSKMHKTRALTSGGFKEYIGVKNFDHSKVNVDDIQDVAIGPDAKSCTSVIKVITINEGKDEEVIIVDCPGLGDQGGCEQDTANILGIVKASKVCSEILPLVVLSANHIGNRGEFVKDYARELSKLFKNMEEATGSMRFLFTKLHKTDVGDFNKLSKEEKKDCKKSLK